MKKVLIYGGTTEGRKLAETLSKAEILCEVSVATEYGEMVLDENPFLKVRTGRLTTEQMRTLYEGNSFDAIIDATHPFATIVTKSIQESVKGLDLPVLRLEREISMERGHGTRKVQDIDGCVSLLRKTTGNILLTTGSKDLAAFCQWEDIRERLIVRVLPGIESLQLCYENGLSGKQIIAMQGPFTEETNIAQIHQYDIKHLVTKESGKTGGVDSKIAAVEKTGICGYMIGRPQDGEDIETYSMEKICEKLGEMFGKRIDATRGSEVILAGIGMGNPQGMTEQVRRKIKEADYIFGARRMLQNLDTSAKLFPYYTREQIVPKIQKLKEAGHSKVVILFSGDTGFFSGCEKIYEVLKEDAGIELEVYPGISCMEAFFAKIGKSWQDAKIVSCHGISEQEWKPKLLKSLQENEKTFFLTSGVKDIRKIGEILEQSAHFLNEDQLIIGYQLSYENERIVELTPRQAMEMEEDGLYVGVVLRKKVEQAIITPCLQDDEFLRDKVPMTKEEVRHLAVCKLGLKENSVVYDIGCGSGSVAIEMAKLSQNIQVYGVEANEEAVRLCRENAAKHHVTNVEIIHGMAPESLKELPKPTHAFIGGTKGKLEKILELLYRKNTEMKVVVTAVSLEGITQVQQCLSKQNILNLEITQIAVSKAKKLGDYHLMQANNPVFMFSFEFGGKDEAK